MKTTSDALAAHTAAAAGALLPRAPQQTMLRGLPVAPAAQAKEADTQTSTTEPTAALTLAEMVLPFVPAKGPLRIAWPRVAAAVTGPQQATRLTVAELLAVKTPHAVSAPAVNRTKLTVWLPPPGTKLAEVVAACMLSVDGAVRVKPCAVMQVRESAIGAVPP